MNLEIDIHLPLESFELRVAGRLEHRATAIFGASGAGKSSLLETLAGLRRGARGSIRRGDQIWLDKRIDLPSHQRRVGYVAQDPLLFPHLSVWRNLLAGGERARAAGKDPDDIARDVARWLEIEALLDRSAASLSGGEQKRVALGRALVSDPHLLLLDEPLANLDLPRRRRLLATLRKLRERTQIPMLLVTHDPVEAQALCDQVWVLDHGRVVARGEPTATLSRPSVESQSTQADSPHHLGLGFETVVPARWSAGESKLEIGPEGSGVELIVSTPHIATSHVMLVGLPARDILLATGEPKGLSARNILPAIVRSIQVAGSTAMVTVCLGHGELSVDLIIELLASTPQRLGIEPGSPIYVVIKASACRVYTT